MSTATHEGAEEEVLPRLAHEDLGTDDGVVAQRQAEEEEAGNALAKLEKLAINSEGFAMGYGPCTRPSSSTPKLKSTKNFQQWQMA